MSVAPNPITRVPEGFRAREFGGGFMAVNGPLYARRTDAGLQLGFRVEERHCNPMRICHGGMMATFCDMLLPLATGALVPELANRFLPTIGLQVDYLAPATLGSWVEGTAEVLHVATSMVFVQGFVTADGRPVARTSGLFKISRVRRDDRSVEAVARSPTVQPE